MAVKNIVFQLAEESKRLTDIEPYLARKIQELDNIVGQYETEEAERGNCISQWQFKIQAMLESFNHGSESSHTDKQYSDEFVQDFVEKLDDNEKSRVHFPDFKGLTEELEKSGRLNLPPSLVPVHETLKKAYRDITAESNQSIPVIRDSYILFCSVIREMNELRLEEIDLEKMILWKDAINSCLSIGIKGSFAIEHLKKIARTYFGSRNKQELKSMEERMLKLKAELYALEKKHNCIAEKQSSEMLQGCLPDANFFQGKPLGSGLFV